MEMKQVVKLDDGSCSCCRADFYKKDLDEQGRCRVCSKAGLQPGGKPKQEYIQQSTPKLDREQIKQIVKEVLIELKEEENLAKPAVFSAKKCAKCGNDFIPDHPAQKYCPNCREDK
jgi:hypothetical protein